MLQERHCKTLTLVKPTEPLWLNESHSQETSNRTMAAISPIGVDELGVAAVEEVCLFGALSTLLGIFLQLLLQRHVV